jgi:hypothetical protein
MSSKNREGLSPVAALCLRVVRGWLGVVSRGKGGELRNGVPYTRLKATEVQQQLEVEQGVAVSSKAVQRALTELVVGGHLSRRQLYKHRYNRTYWYAPGELEQQVQRHRPKVVAATYANQSKQQGQPVPTEGTEVSSQDLIAQNHLLKSKNSKKPNNRTASTEEALCDSPELRQEAVSKAWNKRRPTAPTLPPVGRGGRLQRAQQRLAEVVQRATAGRGFGSREQGPSPKAVPPAHRAECAQAAGFLR